LVEASSLFGPVAVSAGVVEVVAAAERVDVEVVLAVAEAAAVAAVAESDPRFARTFWPGVCVCECVRKREEELVCVRESTRMRRENRARQPEYACEFQRLTFECMHMYACVGVCVYI